MLGITTDAGLVPDPERIVENFAIEFAAARKAAEALSKPKRARRNARPSRVRKGTRRTVQV